MQDDDAPTPEEQAEAETLARALEGKAGAPADALGAAALLAHERRLAAFDGEAQARVERRIAAALPTRTPRRRRLVLWLAPAGALAAAGVAALFLVSGERLQAPSSGALVAELPAPDKALLEAQAQALTQASTAPLEGPMRSHRAAMLTAMRARVGGGR